ARSSEPRLCNRRRLRRALLNLFHGAGDSRRSAPLSRRITKQPRRTQTQREATGRRPHKFARQDRVNRNAVRRERLSAARRSTEILRRIGHSARAFRCGGDNGRRGGPGISWVLIKSRLRQTGRALSLSKLLVGRENRRLPAGDRLQRLLETARRP